MLPLSAGDPICSVLLLPKPIVDPEEASLINEINKLLKVRSANNRVSQKKQNVIQTPLEGLKLLKDLLIETNEESRQTKEVKKEPIDPNLV